MLSALSLTLYLSVLSALLLTRLISQPVLSVLLLTRLISQPMMSALLLTRLISQPVLSALFLLLISQPVFAECSVLTPYLSASAEHFLLFTSLISHQVLNITLLLTHCLCCCCSSVAELSFVKHSFPYI